MKEKKYWPKPNDWSLNDLARAIAFYEKSSDGQYDDIALACIRQAFMEYNLHN